MHMLEERLDKTKLRIMDTFNSVLRNFDVKQYDNRVKECPVKDEENVVVGVTQQLQFKTEGQRDMLLSLFKGANEEIDNAAMFEIDSIEVGKLRHHLNITVCGTGAEAEKEAFFKLDGLMRAASFAEPV